MPHSSDAQRHGNGSRHAANDFAGMGSQFQNIRAGQTQRDSNTHADTRHNVNANARDSHYASSSNARNSSQSHTGRDSSRNPDYQRHPAESRNQDRQSQSSESHNGAYYRHSNERHQSGGGSASGSSREDRNQQGVRGPSFELLQHNGMSLTTKEPKHNFDSYREPARYYHSPSPR